MEIEKKNIGRPKKIKKPEMLWTLFSDYRNHIKRNPITVADWVGKDACKVDREKERPLTMEGFENYCCEQGILSSLQNYFSNKDDSYNEFLSICSRIKRTIRQDQIEGGMAGIYNPSITQRLNNLVDQIEQIHIEQPLFS